jgi:nucleoside-diphosphate-sugar epimerase
MEGVSIMFHIASPISNNEFASYEDFLRPVIEGTNTVIEGCKKFGVKKLIVTSSALTCYGK